MGGTPEPKAFHVEVARKRVREFVKETKAVVAEGGGIDLGLSDLRIDDKWTTHICIAIEWNLPSLQSLDLSFNKFTDNLIHTMAELPELPCLQSLNLSSNSFGDAGSDALGKFLVKAPHLERIDLSLNNFGKTAARHLAQALPTLKHLVALDLSSNKLFDDGCELLCHCLAKTNGPQSLNLAMNGLTDTSGLILANMLASCSGLTRLVLTGNTLSDYGASAIAFSIDKSPNLNELFLDSNTIGNVGATAFLNILRSNPSKTYRKLCLDGNLADAALVAQVQHKCQSMLLSAIYPDPPRDGCINLEGKVVREYLGSLLDDSLSNTVVRIMRSFSDILEVDLSGNAIGDIGALDISLYLAFNPRLTRLNLSRNVITDQGAFGLTKGLLCNSTLVELDVSCNRIGGRGVSSIFATSFDNKKSMLTQIRVKGNLESSEGDAIVQAIVQSKALEKQLRLDASQPVLDLSDLHLRRFGANVLCDLLSHSTTCQVVNLCRNDLGDEGACAIASLLAANKSITKMDLSCNGIGDVGAAALGEALQANQTILALNLRGAYGSATAEATISETGMVTLSAALAENQSLQILDLRDHCSTKRVIALWVQLLQRNATIQKFNGTTPATFLSKHA
ncbi:hypothetical protein Ae201684P_020885 [Aphanomyces euteiches]|uniref:Uncharacterized protein n=1 Tax=Aphanomyces euteiches TaxID=100861 RepID=A0A6G0WWQ9_9STRA|nr:hypothetical protein Ae201684_010915 [Aphanomyces euteiches]KAH9061550.1 hypothetical protein Ae201684P_020885 [Aphanomyces euteiches]KAH9144714.1 hypothetical protein AeRB84_011344 [Aphanomyces euteiches]